MLSRLLMLLNPNYASSSSSSSSSSSNRNRRPTRKKKPIINVVEEESWVEQKLIRWFFVSEKNDEGLKKSWTKRTETNLVFFNEVDSIDFFSFFAAREKNKIVNFQPMFSKIMRNNISKNFNPVRLIESVRERLSSDADVRGRRKSCRNRNI